MRLELTPVSMNETDISCKVTYQEKRNTDSFDSMLLFKASNGIRIISQIYPCFGSAPNILFVKGSKELKDSALIIIPHKYIGCVMKAIREYNEYIPKVEKTTCEGKVVEIDGKKYKLVSA